MKITAFGNMLGPHHQHGRRNEEHGKQEQQQQREWGKQQRQDASPEQRRVDRLRRPQPPQEQAASRRAEHVPASTHKRGNSAYMSTLRADVAARAALNTFVRCAGSALSSAASLTWKACRLDGFLLLTAAGPAACTTFAASICGATTVSGWHLLFSWQAALPLFLLACCCAALYRVACARQQSSGQRMFQRACSQVDRELQQASTFRCAPQCCHSTSTPCVSGQFHPKTWHSRDEEHKKRHLLREEQQPLQEGAAFLYAGDSQQEQQEVSQPEQQQLVPRQSPEFHVLHLQKEQQSLHQEEKPLVKKEGFDRATCEEDCAASAPSWRLVLGGYYKWERRLDDGVNVTSDVSAMPAIASGPAAKAVFTDVVPGCAAVAPVAADASADGGSVTNLDGSRLYERYSQKGTRRQESTTQIAASSCFSKFSTTSCFAGVLIRSLSKLYFSVARWGCAAVRWSFRLVNLHPFVYRCGISALKGNRDRRGDDSTEAAINGSLRTSREPRTSSESEAKKGCDTLTLLEGKGGGPASVASARTGSRSKLLGGAAAYSGAWDECGREDTHCVLAASAKNCYGVFPPPSECAACKAVPFSAKASRGRRKVAATSAAVSEASSTDAAPKAVIKTQRHETQERQGQCGSSALVAALLLPTFFCCWFPVVQTSGRPTETVHGAARPREKGQWTTSSTDLHSSLDELYSGTTRFSSVDAFPPAVPLLLSGDPFVVLRVVLSLLPASLVAGSIVSVLLWYSQTAVVRLREVMWLISTYAAAWVATCWCSPQHIAAVTCLTARPRGPASALAEGSSSLVPSPLPLLGRSRVEHFWAGSGAGAPSQWEQVCFYSVCAAVIISCVALQLLYFHACFRKAPRCFSLVEGSLAAQLATGLTFLCVAYTYSSRRGKRLNRGESWFNFFSHSTPSLNEVPKVFAPRFSTQRASPRSQLLNAVAAFPASADTGWKSFAAHIWLLLLVLIACTLVLAVYDDVRQGGECRKRRAVASLQKEERTNGRAEEQSDKDECLKWPCEKRAAILVFLFLLVLGAYLCCGSVMDLNPSCSLLTERTSHTSGSGTVITKNCNTQSDSRDDLTCAVTSSDSRNSAEATTSRRPGTHPVLISASNSRVRERPIAWLLRIVIHDACHTWLLLLWFTVCVVGIPLATAIVARAAFLETAAASTLCLDAVVLNARQAGYSAPSCGKCAVNDTLHAGTEKDMRKKRSVLLKLFARKLFHFVLVAVVVTGYYAGAYAFTALALCGGLWILILCEYLRVSRAVPKFSSLLTAFFSRFVDCRDKNGLFLTHTYLLLGVALPFVAAAAQGGPTEATARTRIGGNVTSGRRPVTVTAYSSRLWSTGFHQISTTSTAPYIRESDELLRSRAASTATSIIGYLVRQSGEADFAIDAIEETSAGLTASTVSTLQSLLGLLLVGIGDALAALVGMRWGWRKMPYTKSKTYLGTAAFFAGPALLLLLFVVSSNTTLAEQWISLRAGLFAIALATLFEAYTPDIDNCILSLFGVVAYNGALPTMQGWGKSERETTNFCYPCGEWQSAC